MCHIPVFANTPRDLCYDPCLAAFRSPMFILADCEGEGREGGGGGGEKEGGGGGGDILAKKLDPSN